MLIVTEKSPSACVQHTEDAEVSVTQHNVVGEELPECTQESDLFLMTGRLEKRERLRRGRPAWNPLVPRSPRPENKLGLGD